MSKTVIKPTVKPSLPIILAAVALAVLVMVVLIINHNLPITYEMYNSETIAYERGKVTEILSEQTEEAPGMPGWELGNQRLSVRIQTGALKGQEIQLDNNLSTTHNVHVRTGQSVVIKTDRPENTEPYYTVYSYNRMPGLIAVGVIFVIFMLAVGQFKGFKSVLGLAISLFFILAFLLPAIYRGWSPILMSVLTVIIIVTFSLLLLNGFTRKTAVAIVAAAAGVMIAALFFLLLSALLNLSGYNLSEAEELIIISQNTGLQIGQVLFAGVLISSLGAVMDTTLSIASALYEMRALHPDLPGKALFHSGIVIGRDMIGTMCQTLILAFVGSAIATLLVLVSYGTQFHQFVSSDYVAIEVAQAISGSLAIIFAVPLTAALCALPQRKCKNAVRVTAR